MDLGSFGDALGGIGSVVASGATGGIFGGVLSIVGAFMRSKEMKREHQQALQLREEDRKDRREEREYNRELYKMQGERQLQEHENDVEMARVEMSGAGLLASINADAALSENSPPWVNAVKSLFRPFITTLLIVAHVAMMFVLWNTLATGYATTERQGLALVFTAGEIVLLFKYSLESLVFASTTSLTWWFGDRGFAPPKLKG